MARWCLILILFAVFYLARGQDGVITVALNDTPQFVNKSGLDNYTGFGIDLLNILKDKLSFEYKLYRINYPNIAVSEGNAHMSIIPVRKLDIQNKANVVFTPQVLKSSLTMLVNKIDFPGVNNIDDVIATEKLTTAFVDYMPETRAFVAALDAKDDSPTKEKLKKLNAKKGTFASLPEALSAAEFGKTAMLVDSVTARYLISLNGKCVLKSITNFLDVDGYYLLVRNDFNLRDKIDNEINELVKSNKTADLMNKYFKETCVGPADGSVSLISSSLFLISLLALVLAI